MKKGDLVTLKSDIEQKHPMVIVKSFKELSAEIILESPDFYLNNQNSVLCEWVEPNGNHQEKWYDKSLLSLYQGNNRTK